jgi:hypothetical protein
MRLAGDQHTCYWVAQVSDEPNNAGRLVVLASKETIAPSREAFATILDKSWSENIGD